MQDPDAPFTVTRLESNVPRHRARPRDPKRAYLADFQCRRSQETAHGRFTAAALPPPDSTGAIGGHGAVCSGKVRLKTELREGRNRTG